MSGPDVSSEVNAPDYRGLKLTVIAMGVLLIAGFILVLGIIIYRASHKEQDVVFPSAQLEEIVLPADAQIVNSQISADRLVLTIGEADGSTTLVIINLDNGRLIGQVRLARGMTAQAALGL